MIRQMKRNQQVKSHRILNIKNNQVRSEHKQNNAEISKLLKKSGKPLTLKTKLMKYGGRKGAYKLAGVQDEDKTIRAHQQQKVLYSSTLILPLANFNSNPRENKRTLLRTEQPSASKVGEIKKTGGAFLSKVQEDRHLNSRENNSIFKS